MLISQIDFKVINTYFDKFNNHEKYFYSKYTNLKIHSVKIIKYYSLLNNKTV